MIKQSEQTNELDAALVAFQMEMPAVGRDKEVSMKGRSKTGNEYSVNYEYAPLEAIQKIAKPLLAKNGLVVSQFLSYEKILANGSELVQECIITRIAHKSGQYLLAPWPLHLDKIEKEQDRGSKITFNKRYAYTGALDIQLMDEDNDAVGVAATKKPAPKTQNLQKAPSLPEYKIANGKLKGKMLKDLDLGAIQKMLDDADEFYKTKGDKPFGSVKDDLNNAHNYLLEQAELKELS